MVVPSKNLRKCSEKLHGGLQLIWFGSRSRTGYRDYAAFLSP
jgi:hypothetical protein